jgi:DNA polymerase-3 subunit alpha
MAKFAGYGFNKSHSTAYAIIAFQTAYLKANHPSEFMAALISSEIGNADKLPVFIIEAQQMNIEILPPDVNTSEARFKPSEKTIRFGLAGIKNVGEGAADAIVREQQSNGPFKSLIDFCSRIDSQLVNKKVLESLAKCGAFDCFGMHRARIWENIDLAMGRASERHRDIKSGQQNLFDMLGKNETSPTEEHLPDTPPWRENQLLAGEKELLGIYLSGHPLTQYSYLLSRYQLADITSLGKLEDHAITRVGGIIGQIDKKITKKKENMAILKLEDIDGMVEVLVWPEAYQRFGMHITQDAPVLVCGEVSRREEKPKIIAAEIYPLPDAPRHFATQVNIHIPLSHMENGKLDKVKELLRMHPGNTPVTICLMFPTGEKVFMNADRSFKVFPEETLIRELEHILGEKSVFVAVSSNPCKEPRQRRQFSNGNSG